MTEFASLVIDLACPEESLVVPDVAAEYFEHPLRPRRDARRDESLGFGVDLALVTPFALAVAGPVLSYLSSVGGEAVKGLAKDALKEAAKPTLVRLVRRMFRNTTASDGEPPIVLDAPQLERVRDITYRNAVELGLPDEKAQLLADAAVGSLNRPRP